MAGGFAALLLVPALAADGGSAAGFAEFVEFSPVTNWPIYVCGMLFARVSIPVAAQRETAEESSAAAPSLGAVAGLRRFAGRSSEAGHPHRWRAK